MRLQKLFALVCLVSYFCAGVCEAKVLSAEYLRGRISVVIPPGWHRESVDKRLQATESDPKRSCYPASLDVTGRFFNGDDCCIVVGYDDSCKNTDQCSEFDTSIEGVGALARDCCAANECGGLWTIRKTTPYQCDYLHRYGQDASWIYRFADRKVPREGLFYLSDIPIKGPGVYDETAIKVIRSKKPRLLGMLNVIMTCREDKYAEEKPKLDRFLESIRYRGKLVIEPGRDWTPRAVE